MKTTEIQNSTEASTISQDLKDSVLIVSLVTNLIFLTAWIAVQVTSKYDIQLTQFLFN